MEKLYTGQELADYLAVSIHTVERWRMRKVGPSWVSLEAGVRYPESAIVEYLESRKVLTGVAE